MALPASGPISISEINIELGRSYNIANSQLAGGSTPSVGSLFWLGNQSGSINQTAPHAMSEWYNYGITFTYQYQFVTGYYNKSLYFSQDYGSTWNEVLPIAASNNPANYDAIATSYTSQYIAIGTTQNQYLNSNDYGSTYTSRTLSQVAGGIRGIGLSSNGQYQSAIDSGSVFVSSNFGVSFTRTQLVASGLTNTPNLSRIAVSATGVYQIIADRSVVNSQNASCVWVSNNSGVSWVQNIIGSSAATDVAISSTGQYQYAILEVSSVVYLYYSSNYGVNWDRVAIAGLGRLCCSSDGQRVYYTNGDVVYRSSNAGQSFSSVDLNVVPLVDISCSPDGKYVTTAAGEGPSFSGFVYVSSDYGQSFTQKPIGGLSSLSYRQIYVSNGTNVPAPTTTTTTSTTTTTTTQLPSNYYFANVYQCSGLTCVLVSSGVQINNDTAISTGFYYLDSISGDIFYPYSTGGSGTTSTSLSGQTSTCSNLC